ncbi:MAG: DUF262 domain-containing protein [Thermodesulfovibrionales bacterium]
MSERYFEADAFGIGQLITQRKILVVPHHQRDFAWTLDDVTQFYSDISRAWQDKETEYFIGLIVLLGPREGTWTILDGQQRIATTTMIFSGIRNWLSDKGFEDDSRQIDFEFLRARQLGGNFHPRLQMNLSNSSYYQDIVINRSSMDKIENLRKQVPRSTSNFLLLEAFKGCCLLLDETLKSIDGSIDAKKDALFDFARFLENCVECVVMDVSKEANAYVIFESLNARGNELSVLDLVKNYIYGTVDSKEAKVIDIYWEILIANLENRNADDFLKTFWTSRYGRIQRQQLFSKFREKFKSQEEVISLLKELSKFARIFSALDDFSNEFWENQSSEFLDKVRAIDSLGSKQARSTLLAIFSRETNPELLGILDDIISLIVRYQIVGKRRTGALEIGFARVAPKIFREEINNSFQFWNEFSSIVPNDEEFKNDLLKYEEKRPNRLIYILYSLENMARRKSGMPELRFTELIEMRISVERLINEELEDTVFQEKRLDNSVLSFILLEQNIKSRIQRITSFEERLDLIYESIFISSGMKGPLLIKFGPMAPGDFLELRKKCLSDLAVLKWPINCSQKKLESEGL